ncbi:oxygen-dependent protoporphyrinogen oxidase [Nonlabens sp. Hel1_33_55]|uniref:protoporphyrinogen oxidase n=1 Tax=Nonlabens sp. Hel1_33_55 TaxID=1336802 RepID=UPI000875B72D|nr:protoporphyrinogen oxidase [Nonlabens sp. Hel1_33_55]SCX91588.1 oxygen-dependent protoporphyrinogen oxidase [Nonlabens sp. Hel1_33_55]
MTLKQNYDVVILGAGISGLSAGYSLLKSEQDFAILEATDRCGGVIESEVIDGLLVEHGPNSMALTPEVEALCQELHIEDRILPALEESKIRQILWDDQLHTLKASPLTLLSTNLISLGAKLRILKEPFITSKSPAGESVLEFFTRRFGKQVARRMAGAIVSGIYAGDAAQLEMASVFPRFVELEREHGSLLKVLKKSPSAPRKIVSFDRGMEVLTSSLSRKLNNHIHLNKSIQSIVKEADAWKIALENGQEIIANKIISTLPYYKLTKVLSVTDFPNIAVSYNPMLTLQVKITLEELRSKTTGFGFLASSFERKDFIGVLFNGNVFETAVAGDHALMNFFVRPDHCNSQDPQVIFDNLCVPLFRKWTGIDVKLELIHSRFWPQAIPQKVVGHQNKMNQIKNWETQNHGFHVAGNFIYGVSIGDCIQQHLQLSKEL